MHHHKFRMLRPQVFQVSYYFFRAYSNDMGLYIKYVGGGWRVFVGVMKYFEHILMGHEIFLKIFDGPQNIFFFIILFFKLRD